MRSWAALGHGATRADKTWNLPSIVPFQGSIWTTPLPGGASIDASSATVITELASQAASAAVNLNVWAWTAEPIFVPNNQPLVPVSCSGGTADLKAVLALGVPIPPGTRPTNDTDATLLIYQPNYINPQDTGQGVQGRYYELYNAHPNVNVAGVENWSCSYGGRFVRPNYGRTEGHNVDWTSSGVDWTHYATNEHSTYSKAIWGIQGSGLPYLPGILTLNDCRRGYVNHMLLLETRHAASGQWWWPATRSDGDLAGNAIQEGMRFRFPAGSAIPGNLHPIAQLYYQAARDYGLIVTDRSATNCCVRAAPSVGAAGYLGATADFNVMNNFPWSSLQLLAQGSDTTHTV